MNYLTVTALTKYIKHILEGDRHLMTIALKGEISNFKRHSRGHFYFTLKDESASIQAIMFASSTTSLQFQPKEGDHVLVTGKISVYEAGGSYSIQVFKMELDGIGELYLKYEALKKDLLEKGYFDASHKKEVPKFPKIIGVITSPTGAVIEDIKNTVRRRYPLSEIHLYPALVQGQGSKESLVKQLKRANADQTVDVLIIGRGGGSIEDLWSFNELEVVMAIFESKIPIIAAIGHETDNTLSDLIADLRAPTPTAAAELATPNMLDLKSRIKDAEEAIKYRITERLQGHQKELLYLDQRLESLSPVHQLKLLDKAHQTLRYDLIKHFSWLLEAKAKEVRSYQQQLRPPQERIDGYKEKHNHLRRSLDQVIQAYLTHQIHGYRILNQTLQSQNPLKVMDKGFALIKKDDHIVTSVKDVAVDDLLTITMKDGKLTTIIKEKEVK